MSIRKKQDAFRSSPISRSRHHWSSRGRRFPSVLSYDTEDTALTERWLLSLVPTCEKTWKAYPHKSVAKIKSVATLMHYAEVFWCIKSEAIYQHQRLQTLRRSWVLIHLTQGFSTFKYKRHRCKQLDSILTDMYMLNVWILLKGFHRCDEWIKFD